MRDPRFNHLNARLPQCFGREANDAFLMLAVCRSLAVLVVLVLSAVGIRAIGLHCGRASVMRRALSPDEESTGQQAERQQDGR